MQRWCPRNREPYSIIATGRSRCVCGYLLLLSLTLAVNEVAQLLVRRRSEQLLTVIQSLEMRKSSWAEAQTRLRPWSSNIKLDDHCDAHKCSLEITLSDLVYPYVFGANRFPAPRRLRAVAI